MFLNSMNSNINCDYPVAALTGPFRLSDDCSKYIFWMIRTYIINVHVHNKNIEL